jgi:penicillin-binding protein 2
MEAKTGRIVAMASAPTYDPNVWVGGISAKDYKQLTGKNSDYPLLNRAIQGQSAPGSTFKVVSTAAAVEAGYKWDGGYPCTSSYSVGGQVFKNFEGENFGPISLGRALEVSCDTVFYGLADSQWKKDGGINPKKGEPKDYFYKAAHQFGLGKTTGVDLPNEVTGRIPDRKWKQETWEANKAYWCKTGKKGGTYVQQIAYENCLEGNKMREGDSINYSIGQGDTLVTPIQEAMIYGALANGGTEYVPTIGKAIVSADGKTVQEIKPKVKAKLPISAGHAQGHRQGPRGRGHQRYRRLEVPGLAAGQDRAARQDGYGRGLRQADHLLVRHVHQGLHGRHDDRPGRYGFRRLR